MKDFIECETINQFRVGGWLAEQGITDEIVTSVDTSDPDALTVYNALGQSLRVRWIDDHAEIDRGEAW